MRLAMRHAQVEGSSIEELLYRGSAIALLSEVAR